MARSVNKLSHTSTIAYLRAVMFERGTLRIESKRPAPAMFLRSSKVELDLTATKEDFDKCIVRKED